MNFRDEIHGDMQFPGILIEAINHPFFQRLRNIKQLGLTEFVFACASHNRFQHSLGAAFLSLKYFDHLLTNFSSLPFQKNIEVDGKTFLFEDSQKAFQAVAESETSRNFWMEAIGLAALLHDVGHGPWSHTFETLHFKQEFSEDIKLLPSTLQNYFKNLPRLEHEDISILYLQRIIRDLDVPEAEQLFYCVAKLINKRLPIEKEIGDRLAIHRLLRPIISGPFDVDRMDYIQRDSRNCGVHIGGIEWQRIMTKLLPCLQPNSTALVSSLKNQHVLDDFIFSLFQMYTQVYLHPKVVAMEEVLKRELESTPSLNDFRITLEIHSQLTDELFKNILVKEFKLEKVEQMLYRRKGFELEANVFPPNFTPEGYEPVKIENRAMMKDIVDVYLSSTGDTLSNWMESSPVAKQFLSVEYSPNLWIRLS